MNKKGKFSFGLILSIITIFNLGFFVLTVDPQKAQADFFGDVFDFFDPVNQVENIIDGNPENNLLPPLPGIDINSNSSNNTNNQNQTATISAVSIVCPTENLLPNWGSGGADINSSTASNFLASHPTCYTESRNFEWAPANTSNPGNQLNAAGGSWTPFSGNTTVTTSSGSSVWMREQFTSGYIPFTGGNSNQSVSAEFYCSNDVLNYDNYEWINPVTNGRTYYCVAFNALTNQVQVQNPTTNISASPTSVSYNGSSTITWNSSNATSCSASGGVNGWSGSKNTSGTFYTGTLTNTTTYYITCTNSTGSANDSVTVSVGNQVQNPTTNISASPTSVSYNGSSTITWNSTNATSCSASGGVNGWSGSKNTSGTFYTGALTNTTTYYITCTNSTGSVNESITINVGNNNNNQNPTVYLSASPSSIQSGQISNLSWNSNNTNSCYASWSGNNTAISGSMSVYPTYTTNYSITCYGYNGAQVSDAVTVYVNNNNQLSVTTNSPTNITSNSATLNGYISGNNTYTTAWFNYGTNTNFGYTTNQTSYNYGYSNHSAQISGLIPNTTYYFRLAAQSSQGIIYGNTLSFNTTTDYVNNQPTVAISADSSTVSYNGATTLRWYTSNATSCTASGGGNGWSGTKSIGPGSFYTGSLTETRTYTITCSNNVGSSTDSVTVSVRSRPITPNPTTPTSLVLITSSIDRNQPIVPTLDNTRPHPGDEINYTVSYQNVGTGSITGLNLQINLPQELNYMFSTPSNPSIFGNTLIFNLGTLRANGQGSVTIRAKVRDNILAGTNLNFPAILSYVDPSGQNQSVNANVSAQVWSATNTDNSNLNNNINLGANVFGAGFLPTNLFGWLLLFVLILLLMLLVRHMLNQNNPSFSKKTVTTTEHH